MPPPRIFHPRQSEREAEFRAARTSIEVERLLRAWATEDPGEQQIQASRLDAVESAVVDERLTRLERQVADLQDALTGEGADALVEVLGKAFSIRDRRLDKLERNQIRFEGVHEAGKLYEPNSLVIRRGGLWVSVAQTSSAPGDGEGNGWRLAVKSGSVSREPVLA
jgi:hypothetical protein